MKLPHVILLALATGLSAQTIHHVPATYPTIQSAINACLEGDIVQIAEGVYFEHDLSFGGRTITVRGAGAAKTVVNGAGLGRVFNFVSGETQSAILEHVTITGGLPSGVGAGNVALRWGGGVLCAASSPTLRDCKITQNATSTDLGSGNGGHGGGIACWWGASPVLIRCTISHNACSDGVTSISGSTSLGGSGGGLATSHANGGAGPFLFNCEVIHNRAGNNLDLFGEPGDGGGVWAFDGGVTLTNCVIADNFTGSAPYQGGSGGGVAAVSSGSHIAVLNCTVAENRASLAEPFNYGAQGGGLFARHGSLVIRNSVIWGNVSLLAVSIASPGGSVVASWSDIEGGFPGVGNIDQDPQLTPSWRLLKGSPCVNTGDPSILGLPVTDIDGEPRITAAVVDMGADEVGREAFRLVVSQGPAGDLTLENSGGDPGVSYWTIFSLDPLNQTSPGTGWLGGLHLSTAEFLAQFQVGSLGLAPFGGTLDSAGTSTWTTTRPWILPMIGVTFGAISAHEDPAGGVRLTPPLSSFTLL